MFRVLVQFTCVLLILSPLSFQAHGQTTRDTDPLKTLISTTDIKLFWQAYDAWRTGANSEPDQLAGILDRDYIKKGSQGVQDFIPHRIVSADALAKEILNDPKYYENVRTNTEKMESFVPEIRKAFENLKTIYPAVKFPPVYFVIGRRNSGGTDSSDGLIIGAEMFADTGSRVNLSDLVSVVIHELIHYQQQSHGTDLVSIAMNEGAADFIAELVTGNDSDETIKPYGDSHEEDLWTKFQEDSKSNKLKPWLYNGADEQRSGPPDLGYYVGYKICQSFYESATDKRAAITTIIEMKDPKAIMEQSGYPQRFH